MDVTGPARVRALLTDLDGVVRHWPKTHASDIEHAAELPSGALPATAFHQDMVLPAITGRISHEAWAAAVASRLASLHPQSHAHRAVEQWFASPGQVDKEVLSLLQAARSRATLVLVTNATSRLPRDLTALGLDGAFDAVINASEVGHAKPSERIYQVALAAAGVPAAEAAFVDDRLENVEAAVRLGMRGHVFLTAAGLAEALADWGLVST